MSDRAYLTFSLSDAPLPDGRVGSPRLRPRRLRLKKPPYLVTVPTADVTPHLNLDAAAAAAAKQHSDDDQSYGGGGSGGSSAGRTRAAAASDSSSSLRHGSASMSGTPVGGVSLCRYEKTHARRMLHSSPLATPTPSGFTPTGGTPTLTPVTGVAFMDLLKEGSNPFALVDSLHLAPISESKTSATAGPATTVLTAAKSDSRGGFPSLPEPPVAPPTTAAAKAEDVGAPGTRRRPTVIYRRSVSDVYGAAAVAKTDFPALVMGIGPGPAGGRGVTAVADSEDGKSDGSPRKNEAMPIGGRIENQSAGSEENVIIEDEVVEESFEEDEVDDDEAEEDFEEDSASDEDVSGDSADDMDAYDIRNKVNPRDWPADLLKRMKLPKSVMSWVNPLNCGNGIVDSRFKKLRELGSGVSGTVWQVSDRKYPARQFALKSIPVCLFVCFCLFKDRVKLEVFCCVLCDDREQRVGHWMCLKARPSF